MKTTKITVALAAIALASLAFIASPSPTGGKSSGPNPEVPVISAHPVDAEYGLNETAVPLTVDASVSDGGTLSYQWYSNATNSNQGGAKINSADQDNYTPPTNAPGTTYYYVVVTNSLNNKTATKASGTAEVLVDNWINAEHPVIATQPQSVEYGLNDSAAPLTVVATTSDNGTLTYQWYFNAADSNEGGTAINSATQANYTPPTGTLGTVYYYVVVTNTITDNNDGGNKTVSMVSNTAMISVKTTPGITAWPTSSPITYGAALSTSTLSGGSANIPGSFSWTDGTIIPIVGNTGYEVTFTPTNAAHYRTVTQMVSITVSKADPVVTWPAGLTAVYGQILSDIDFSGNGTGSPAGTFTWTTPSTSLATLGRQSHGMTFTPNDTANYNVATNNISILVRLGVEMAPIPAGTFTMGSPTDEPDRDSGETQRTVTLSAFYMGKYQVTQEQWYAVKGTNPSYFTTASGRPPAAGEMDARRPVDCVTWYMAVEFCNNLSEREGLQPAYTISGTTVTPNWSNNGYRLPTEAQWEYACRAGTTTAYYNELPLGDVTGWYDSNSGNKTHQVGLKPSNNWGLHDMAGNVHEWCWDWSEPYPSVDETDPTGPTSTTTFRRVLRGGSWSYPGRRMRSADRGFSTPNVSYVQALTGSGIDGFGFRLVRPSE
jgi:formylglycine-generating enzyme required for sulfatase activity